VWLTFLQRKPFVGFITAALVGTALGLLMSACSLPAQTADPVEVTFTTPESEIEGGVRLEPAEPRWDGLRRN
jgi:hypothetical protein